MTKIEIYYFSDFSSSWTISTNANSNQFFGQPKNNRNKIKEIFSVHSISVQPKFICKSSMRSRRWPVNSCHFVLVYFFHFLFISWIGDDIVQLMSLQMCDFTYGNDENNGSKWTYLIHLNLSKFHFIFFFSVFFWVSAQTWMRTNRAQE